MSEGLRAALNRIEAQLKAVRPLPLLRVTPVSPERQQQIAEAFKRARARAGEVKR